MSSIQLKHVPEKPINHQKLCEWFDAELNVLLLGEYGVGKCLGKNTPIIMFDGTTKMVQDIKVGDKLMGPDSTPRNVLSLARGREKMYKVTPTKGDAYTVNASHILSLKMASTGWGVDKHIKHGQVVNISVNDYLKQNGLFKASMKGYRASTISWPFQALPIAPYMFGAWLGDGSSAAFRIHNQDQEVIDYLKETYHKRSGTIVVDYRPVGKCPSFNVTKPTDRSFYIDKLKALGVHNDKHIPSVYKVNSEANRLQLLAGIIDTDGSYSDSSNHYDVISKSRELANDIAFVAHSLGLAAYVKPCTKCCPYKGEQRCGRYYRIGISGDVDRIPCKIARKQARPRQQVKNVLVTGIKVKDVGVGNYYGFTIDGDHLFLLGDFTVTHNTMRILKVFEEKLGTKWAFFNGATTDPWTDLIGIPSVDESTGTKIIKYVRPEELDDSLGGIYIDELNRAKTATRNALLELIQFKSINGRKFPNLKVVWASINPPRNEEDANAFIYDVEELDPAQVDRFHIIVKIPNEPDISYFTEKFKLRGTNLVDWWKQQCDKTKQIVSPRRLEYIANLWAKGIDVSDALPICANIKMLKKMIDSAPVINRFNDLKDKREKAKGDAASKINEEIANLMNDENNFEELKEYIIKNGEWNFLKWLKNEEKIDLIYQTHPEEIKAYFYQNTDMKSRLFRVLNRHLQDDEGFQQAIATFAAAHKSDEKSAYIKYVDSDEDAIKLIDKYLANRDDWNTYHRRTNSEYLCANMPRKFTDRFAGKLLEYINAYTSKVQGFTMKEQYAKPDNEYGRLLNLTKAYIAYAKEKGLDYKSEPFAAKWAAAEVRLG